MKINYLLTILLYIIDYRNKINELLIIISLVEFFYQLIFRRDIMPQRKDNIVPQETEPRQRKGANSFRKIITFFTLGCGLTSFSFANDMTIQENDELLKRNSDVNGEALPLSTQELSKRPLLIGMSSLHASFSDDSLSDAGIAHEDPERQIRILSLDGGGVRGVVEARILMRIEEQTGRPVTELFDLIGGTSVGGLLATMLTIPKNPEDPSDKTPLYSAAEIFSLLYQNKIDIFKPSWFSLGGLLGPKYQSKHYVNELKRYMGDLSMSQSVCPTVVFAYNTEMQRIDALSSWDTKSYTKVDAVASTTAAQTLFHPHTMTVVDNAKGSLPVTYTYTDGGTGVNNPAALLLGKALNLFPEGKNFEVLSIGTGSFNTPIYYDQVKSAGLLAWLPHFSNVVFNSQQSSFTLLLEDMLNAKGVNGKSQNVRGGGQYLRWNPPLNLDQSSMDDMSSQNIRGIVQATDMYLVAHKTEFDTYVNGLMQTL